MLLVQEHLIKLGGVKLSGQMKSIDISEVATPVPLSLCECILINTFSLSIIFSQT